jgi:hypothetical protein
LSPEEHTHSHVDSPAARRKWVGGWTTALLVAGGTILWCLLIYHLIGDRPPGWQYGVVPYIPGQSVLSSQPPPRGTVPKQVTLPLREAGGANAKR